MTVVDVPSSSATVRLLLVEDDPGDAYVIGVTLRRCESPQFAVTHVATIAEACDRIVAGGVDLVLLDLGLPDAHELDGLSKLHACAEEIPIVVLTGRDDDMLALNALQRGAEDYLVKSKVDRAAILRSIRYAMERHRGLREMAKLTRELHLANATLERLTLVDPLTDLLNRRALQQALSREVQELRRGDVYVLVLLIDIDDFKRVNDAFGHAVGDVALKEVAHKLRSCVRTQDSLARIGGDEFMILMPGVKTAEASRIAERTRLTIATTLIQHSGGNLKLTASIAARMLTSDTPSIDELLSRMHKLLRKGKDAGKNRVSFAPEQFSDPERTLRMHADMCTHLAQGKHLITVKQPIYRLADEIRIGYELLSRYSNGVWEMPESFFRISSENNVLTAVDHQCLRRAVLTATELKVDGRFHLNLFPSTMIAIPVHHLLESFPHPVPPKRFCIEISEQQIIGDPSYLLDPVTELRQAGLLIALDDVGFGHSCLESLVILQPDVIKIDKRCVIGLESHERRVAELERYLTVARSFEAEVVAEGIETAEELTILRDLGVAYGQGFLWGRPA